MEAAQAKKLPLEASLVSLAARRMNQALEPGEDSVTVTSADWWIIMIYHDLTILTFNQFKMFEAL